MKFGLEAEKFIFDVKAEMPSQSVFSLLDALADFDDGVNNFSPLKKITNEFVLHMVEFGTTPSSNAWEVLKDYFFNYMKFKTVAGREKVELVPLASLPMDYLPHMTPRKNYHVQNSILSGKKLSEWGMGNNSPLRAAGNCAGVHVHIEVETSFQYLYSNDELKNKFNMALMMTPLIAFSSSPYFFLEHKGKSMRGLKYYNEVYQRFPLNGGFPQVAESSIEVLDFMKRGGEIWVEHGRQLGFTHEDMEAQLVNKCANWNPVRWNGRWNTIELRCLESDSLMMDAAKFIWVVNAMKRMDVKGENLRCAPLKTSASLDHGMIQEALKVSGNEVSILPSHAIQELFARSMASGTRDDLVEDYLYQLALFSQKGLKKEEVWLFNVLLDCLEKHETTSEGLLRLTKGRKYISQEEAKSLVMDSIESHQETFHTLNSHEGGDLHV